MGLVVSTSESSTGSGLIGVRLLVFPSMVDWEGMLYSYGVWSGVLDGGSGHCKYGTGAYVFGV